MNSYLVSFALLALAGSAHACPDLEGRWKSDRESTMAYNDEHVRMSTKARTFISDMMGRLIVRFDGREAHYRMMDWTAVIEGKSFDMTGMNETAAYEVIYCSEKVVVTKTKTLFTAQDQVVVYNFVGPDRMWIYTGGADSELPDSHFREYFVRLPTGGSRRD